MTLIFSQVELSALVRGLAAQFQVIATQIGIQACLAVDDGITITADSEQLQRALLSLWTTLARITAPKGVVSVTLEKKSSDILLRLESSHGVQDILPVRPQRPLDHLESLLEGGPDLLDTALHHVEAIISGHQGHLEILCGKDDPKVFEIRLPRLVLKGETFEQRAAEAALMDPPDDAAPQMAHAPPSSAEDNPRSDAKLPCVLVLISHPDLNAFAAEALSSGCEVVTAFDWDVALGLIETRCPELIVTEQLFRTITTGFQDCPLLAGVPLMTLIVSRDPAVEDSVDVPLLETFLRMPFTQRILRSRADRLIRQCRSATRLIRKSEARYRVLFHSSPEAIVVSRQERVILVNHAAVDLFRAKDESELIGQWIYDIVDPQYRSVLHQRVEHARRTGKPLPLFEQRIMCLDREPLDVEVLSVPIDEDGEVTIHSLLRDLSERRALERQVIEVATDEQVRIGAEIHDSIGQELTALDLLSYALERQVRSGASNELVAARLEELRGHVERALSTTRMLAKGLSPAQIGPDGLPDELSRLAFSVMSASGVECVFNASGVARGLNENVAAHLFRIAQEAVNNAVKHARSDKIEILLEALPKATRLSVIDDGIGMGSSGLRESGVGLRTMRYRAHLIGANLKITTDEGGTRIECALPTDASKNGRGATRVGSH